ncbi:MAG: aldo/keto reductase [Opitutales bacterium]|nr:aldo/keto reductase [Opitutales bacterium]
MELWLWWWVRGGMLYRALGLSGVEVSAMGMGCMPLSVREERPSREEGVAVFQEALRCGVNFFDTADCYCTGESDFGHNERLVGDFLRSLSNGDRERVIVATKGGIMRSGADWVRNGRPDYLKKACEESLRNLGVERIDLYQHHRIDPEVPLEDSLGAFAELREEGKIAHVGVSNYGVEEIERARKIVPVVSVQNQLGPNHREPEWSVTHARPGADPNTPGTLSATRDGEMAFLPWCPLGGMGTAKKLAQAEDGLGALAKELGGSPCQIVLAWLLHKGPHVIPIPGASRKESIRDSSKAVDFVLEGSVVAQLEDIFLKSFP